MVSCLLSSSLAPNNGTFLIGNGDLTIEDLPLGQRSLEHLFAKVMTALEIVTIYFMDSAVLSTGCKQRFVRAQLVASLSLV